MIVADTNLIAYFLIEGPFSGAAQRVWDLDPKWLAPSVWRHEMLNLLATSVRSRLISMDRAIQVWIHAPAFVREADIDSLDVLDLAVTAGFATFDCFYIALARKLGTYLVTADQKLLNAFPDVAKSIEAFADRR